MQWLRQFQFMFFKHSKTLFSKWETAVCCYKQHDNLTTFLFQVQFEFFVCFCIFLFLLGRSSQRPGPAEAFGAQRLVTMINLFLPLGKHSLPPPHNWTTSFEICLPGRSPGRPGGPPSIYFLKHFLICFSRLPENVLKRPPLLVEL